MILALLCAVAQGAKAWEGSGTESDPYLIKKNVDWWDLDANVRKGNNYKGLFFRLANDLDTEGIQVGTEDKPFCGTFDGDGHTLTFDMGVTGNGMEEWINYIDDYCAPFVRLDGATIRHLKVEGRVFSKKKFAAGIASFIDGNEPTTIYNCHVSNKLYAHSDLFDDATYGGLVGVVSSTCKASPTIEQCSFTGYISANRSSGIVGFAHIPVIFKHCLMSPSETIRINGGATFVRLPDNVTCTMEECYYTQTIGVQQGEGVFSDVLLPDDCTYSVESGNDITFNGKTYYKNGTWIWLSTPDDMPFDHWDSYTNCHLTNPWERNGRHQISDILGIPVLHNATSMPKAKKERTMDGTRYRYLGVEDYRLYFSDSYCAQKGYYIDNKGWLVRNINGSEVYVTAVVGWVGGKIPSDGAQIHNDLVGDWRDHSLMGCIAPGAFKGCTELKTLYFKDTDANNYNTKCDFDFIIGEEAFADCPNLTEVKMMQYTTRGDNHWEALRPDQVGYVASDVFKGSTQAWFSTDAGEYQNFLSSATWKDVNTRIFVYNHTNVDMTVNGARYTYVRNTAGEALKNDSTGHEALMQTLQYWNADYEDFSVSNLLSNSDENIWYTEVVGADDSYLGSNNGVMRIYNDPGSYYNYKTIAIGRNAFKGSKNLRAIEFWQTNGRSSNSYSDIKMVIQNGAFANCDSLKELRMYYYVEDGDNHWEVLGPKDIVPGDNIFGVAKDGEPVNFETASFIPTDFKIIVSPELYHDFINDPNWAQYLTYIQAREYEPTTWNPVTQNDLVYDYASKVVNNASANFYVTQNLSWWNVPVKVFEAVSLYMMIKNSIPAVKAIWKKFTEYSTAATNAANGNAAAKTIYDGLCEPGNQLINNDLTKLDDILKLNPNNTFLRGGEGSADIQQLIKKGILDKAQFESGHNLAWTANAKKLITDDAEIRLFVGQCAKRNAEHFLTSSINGNALPVTAKWNQFYAVFLKQYPTVVGNSVLPVINRAICDAYGSYLSSAPDMTEDQFQRGLTENFKARIHDVTYDNTLIYTPDKKLIYQVYVSKPATQKKSYTIYNDIGTFYNYRTVAIKKSAFQGNKTLEEINFAETPYNGNSTYAPLLLTIPDSAFAGCTNLRRFSLLYKVHPQGIPTEENEYRGLGPENFILGGNDIFAGCDSTKLQIIIPEDRKQDFLDDEIWSKYKRFFVYETPHLATVFTEYGANYTYSYLNNSSKREERVSGHTITHLAVISANNDFLDKHQGSMALFNDIGSFNNYQLDYANKKAFANNEHLKTVSFWDLIGGDAYTKLNMTLGDSLFINCKNLKNIDMIYCVTDGTDHLEPLTPTQVRPGKGMFDGSPDCIIKMMPQQLPSFEADTAWAKYKERFLPCIIPIADEGVQKALKKWRYYTPCCSPSEWEGYCDLARIGGQGFSVLNTRFTEYKDDILSFSEFKSFEVVKLDYVGINWFRDCSKLSNIVLPSTIKTIYDSAFNGCKGLREIELPEAVENIKQDAFSGCTGLTTIIVHGKKPATIGANVFTKNDGLKIVVPTESFNDYIKAWAEYKDYIVTETENPIRKVVDVKTAGTLAEELGLEVEWSYSGLHAGDEPYRLHGNYAKYDSLTVSGPLNDLDLWVIRYLAGNNGYMRGGQATDGKLQHLNLNGASIVEDSDCKAHYLNLPMTFMSNGWMDITDNNVLPRFLFYNCTALKSVILPKSLTAINTHIFAGCNELKSVAITASLQHYDERTYSTGLLDYPLEELVFFTDSPAQSKCKDPWGQTIMQVYTKAAQTGDYMNQTYLNRRARNISSFFEEDIVTEILAEKGHFFPSGHAKLTDVEGIFNNQQELRRFKDFELFENVRTLGDNSFRDCRNLEIITLPYSLESVSARAFENCSKLDTIYVYCDSVPELAADAFESLPSDFRILVPKSMSKRYKEKWAQYADHINADQEFYIGGEIKVVTVHEPNTLAEALGLEAERPYRRDFASKMLTGVRGDYGGITRLKVIGPISSTDFDLLRYLAGYCPWTYSRNNAGHLEYLDLYDANIVKDDYGRFIEGEVVTGHVGSIDNDELPVQAFLKAYSLKTLILPKTCKTVLRRALQECENLEELVLGDDMEYFNWNALDDNVSLTRMYILAKKKVEIGTQWAVWRWLCNNYNPTFDAFYVRPSLYREYIIDDNYTGSSWQRTNNISMGAFDDDESFCAFASHAVGTTDDIATITSVNDWFKSHPDVKDLSMLSFSSIDSLSKETLAPLTKLEQVSLPVTLRGMEEGLFENAKNLRYVDFQACDSTEIVAGLHGDGLKKLGIDTQKTLVYVPETYGESDGTNIVSAVGNELHAKAYRMVDTLNYMVPTEFKADMIENSRVLTTSAIPYTMCVPYKMNVPAYARAYTLSDRDGNSLVFKEVTGELEAMKPYLIKVVGNKRLRKNSTTLNTDIAQTIPASGGNTYGQQVDGVGYSLRGTFDAIDNETAAERGAYILQSDGDWHPVANSTEAEKAATILSFRAYLLPSSIHANDRVSMMLEDATDIDTIETIDNDGTHRYYDLNGRELPGKPEKGIYIHNGKKFIAH